MRQSREILRQKLLLGCSHRAIAASVRASVGAVGLAVSRAKLASLTWETVASIDDAELERRLYPAVVAAAERVEPDCAWIHRERHRPGVTLELLHHEYLEQHPDGLRYTAFCERYREWLGRRGLVMRQRHLAGDKLFVDYSGKKPSIVDPLTGEVVEVELFVAVLGASNLTYAEVTRTQRGPDWIASHVRALEYFGGVPAALVPDQLKSGVTRHVLESDEGEAETVREIYRLYVTHGGAKAVARTLNQRGLRYRTGLAWNKNLVLDVLDEEAVVGTYWTWRVALDQGDADRRRRGVRVGSAPSTRSRSRWRGSACNSAAPRPLRLRVLRAVRSELPARDVGQDDRRQSIPILLLQLPRVLPYRKGGLSGRARRDRGAR